VIENKSTPPFGYWPTEYATHTPRPEWKLIREGWRSTWNTGLHSETQTRIGDRGLKTGEHRKNRTAKMISSSNPHKRMPMSTFYTC